MRRSMRCTRTSREKRRSPPRRTRSADDLVAALHAARSAAPLAARRRRSPNTPPTRAAEAGLDPQVVPAQRAVLRRETSRAPASRRDTRAGSFRAAATSTSNSRSRRRRAIAPFGDGRAQLRLADAEDALGAPVAIARRRPLEGGVVEDGVPAARLERRRRRTSRARDSSPARAHAARARRRPPTRATRCRTRTATP